MFVAETQIFERDRDVIICHHFSLQRKTGPLPQGKARAFFYLSAERGVGF